MLQSAAKKSELQTNKNLIANVRGLLEDTYRLVIKFNPVDNEALTDHEEKLVGDLVRQICERKEIELDGEMSRQVKQRYQIYESRELPEDKKHEATMLKDIKDYEDHQLIDLYSSVLSLLHAIAQDPKLQVITGGWSKTITKTPFALACEQLYSHQLSLDQFTMQLRVISGAFRHNIQLEQELKRLQEELEKANKKIKHITERKERVEDELVGSVKSLATQQSEMQVVLASFSSAAERDGHLLEGGASGSQLAITEGRERSDSFRNGGLKNGMLPPPKATISTRDFDEALKKFWQIMSPRRKAIFVGILELSKIAKHAEHAKKLHTFLLTSMLNDSTTETGKLLYNYSKLGGNNRTFVALIEKALNVEDDEIELLSPDEEHSDSDDVVDEKKEVDVATLQAFHHNTAIARIFRMLSISKDNLNTELAPRLPLLLDEEALAAAEKAYAPLQSANSAFNLNVFC